MREFALLISNYTVFTLVASGLAAMQASLWLHIFGYTPAPYLWLILINFWALNRNVTEAVIMVYIITYAMVTMSGIPMGMAFAVNLSLFGLIFGMRNRVLWSGPNSFMLSCGITALTLPVFTFVWSHILESRPQSVFHFFDFLIRALLTSAASLPLYYLFIWLDKVTVKLPAKDGDTGLT